MKIGIIGAGGVGGYYGGVLARAGHEVTLLARGDHLEALRSRGVELRTPDERFTVPIRASGDREDLLGSQLVVVAVKAYSLPEVGGSVERLASAGADVLPLLNGVDAADRLEKAGVSRDRILGGLTAVSAAKTGPGRIERFSAFARITVGELDGGRSDRAERIAETFREAGVDASASADIELDLWRKYAFISALAAGCGLARSAIGPLRETPLGPLLLERAVREVGAVARARGVALSAGEEDGVLELVESIGAEMKPSFLLDLEGGGRTELDVLSGAIARMGRAAGVETPVHDTAAAALGIAGDWLGVTGVEM